MSSIQEINKIYQVVDCCMNCDYRYGRTRCGGTVCSLDDVEVPSRMICNYYVPTTNPMIRGGEKKNLGGLERAKRLRNGFCQ